MRYAVCDMGGAYHSAGGASMRLFGMAHSDLSSLAAALLEPAYALCKMLLGSNEFARPLRGEIEGLPAEFGVLKSCSLKKQTVGMASAASPAGRLGRLTQPRR